MTQGLAAAGDASAVVTVDRLSFTYPGGAQALCEVSFSVRAGRRVAVLGPNGAGKSTLLLHLSGILPSTPATSGKRPAVSGAALEATSGPSVTIEGVPLTARTLPQIRRRVGLVFQNPDDQLFCPTVYDDIAFGPRNLGMSFAEVSQRVADSLAQVGLSQWQENVESAVSPLRRNPLRLSLGQKKRVALATVLAMRPAVVALDEPTANLDPRGRTEIVAVLAGLSCTQIVVTHDLDLVRELCDEAILMAGGKVLKAGAAAEVLADRAALQAATLI